MSISDITVIGAGVIGLTTARELAGRGATVTVIERGLAGKEASWAGGGILSPLHPWRYPDELLRLARFSQGMYGDFAQLLRDETGMDPEWTRSGLLILDQEEIAAAQAWGERWEMPLEVLLAGELRGCEPALNPEFESAIYLPEIAQVRNPRLLKALRRSLELRGVTLQEHTEVTGFVTEADRVTKIATTSGNFACASIVLTAGAWTGGLTGLLGGALPIEPVLGQMLLYKGPTNALGKVVLRGPHYVIPRRDGHVLVGSTTEHRGFDNTITRAARTELAKAGRTMVPLLKTMTLEHHWSGLRPGSPRGVPYLGRHPKYQNLFVNAGHFRNGLMLSPACARLIADVLLGEEPACDIRPYALDRPT